MTSATASMICRRCGAGLEYTPGQNTAITCRYCGEAQPIAAAPAAAAHAAASYEELLTAGFAGGPRAAVELLGCETCGATTTRPANVVSDRCPFCGSPVIARGGATLRAPDGVLPFALDEARALARVAAWERALWFKPGPLFASPPPLQPLYLPYWSFDWEVSTEYAARSSRKNGDARGTVRARISGSTVLASATVPASMGADLEPWDLDAIVAPREELLLGVRAETHGEREGLSRGAALSHRILEREVDHAVKAELGDDRAEITSRVHRYQAVAFRLLLLPVFCGSYAREGRTWRVLVNARTGEVVGERPVSRGGLIRAAILPFALPLVAAIVTGAAAREGAAAVAAFWACLAVEGVVILAGIGGGDEASPERHGQYFLVRPEERGSENIAEIAAGVAQHDPAARRQMLRGVGIVAIAASLFPLLGVLLLRTGGMPLAMVIAFHIFAALIPVAFWMRARDDAQEKRALLGLDEQAPGAQRS